ncbi:MAG: DUF554 domain-containing protein [Clostridiales bacterium]|nr:DUF554 domain-containing protein [Clostridiales bacterium]
MIGLGAIINTVAVIAGSAIGIFLKKGLKDNIQKALMSGCGVATIFIGAAGTLQGMMTVNDGAIETGGSMLLIFSLTLGSLLGEIINVEKRMDSLGNRLKKLFHAERDSRFVDGFVNTSLVICVGAMAIVGSIQDGLNGDASMLTAKAILDFVLCIVFASTYGIGVMCSAIPILVYEGAMTLVAHFAGNFISDTLIGYLSYVGSALIFCVGVNVAFGNKFKVGNMLPALLIPVFYVILF